MKIFNKALNLHKAGELDQAKLLYQQLLAEDPNNIEVLHLLAITCAQQNELKDAQKYLERALQLETDSPELHNSMGNVFKKMNQLELAALEYHEALTLQPNYVVAYNNLGNVLLLQGEFAAAVRLYKNAIELRPNYIDAHFNLAIAFYKESNFIDALQELDKTLELQPNHLEAHNKKAEILHQQDELEDALFHYKECLKLDPTNPEVYHNIGAIFLRQHNPDAALKYFLRLVQFTTDIDAYYNLGVIYMYQNRVNEAIRYLAEVVNLDPEYLAAHLNLGAIYLKEEQYKHALHHYLAAQKLQPGSADIKYIIDVMEGKGGIKQAPNEYIINLFNQYATYFDKHLTESLDYKVPELLYKSTISELNRHDNLTILDLGCGTGLAGEQFKSIAGELIGVDLSTQMLAVAKEKEIYSQLYAEDLNSALQKFSNIDLIIASDTLVYIGDLAETFNNCVNALKTGGVFSCSLEKTHKYPYQLLKTARFAHSKKYIEELAGKNNFAILNFNNIILRKNKGKSIEGYLYVFRKT